MHQDSLMDIWERIRDLLRKLRGENRWRGTELHVLPKLQVRLQAENRGNRIQGMEVIIHLSDAEIEVWAEVIPGREKFHLKDFNHDMAAFVAHLTDLCRGAEYVQTNSKSANYRRKAEEAK